MEILPRPLFGSARSLYNSDQSAPASAKAFLGEIDPALKPMEAYELAAAFLENRRDFADYDVVRSLIERLLLWTLLIRKAPLLSLARADAFDFIWFMQDPPETWLCGNGTLRFMKVASTSGAIVTVPNPKWRPFTIGGLPTEASTLYKAVNVCSVFCKLLVSRSLAARNPFAELIYEEPSTETPTAQASSTLTADDWALIVSAAKRLAAAKPGMHERTLFLITSLAYLNVRCSDFIDSDGNCITFTRVICTGEDWLLRLDSGDIEMSYEFLDSYMRRYMHIRGICFERDAAQPLIPRIKGCGQVTRRTLVKISKDAVVEALRHMAASGASEARLQSLRDAYGAWLRSDVNLAKASNIFRDGQISADAGSSLRPLFVDYNQIQHEDGVMPDHSDTLLYLESCTSSAEPFIVYQYAKEYLGKFLNKNSFDNYRRYVERLMLWTFQIKHKSVRLLTLIDLHEFFEFCKCPPESWVRTTLERRFINTSSVATGRVLTHSRPNPEWRPFWINIPSGSNENGIVYHASHETSSGQYSVIRSFYAFLLSKGIVDSNPLINHDAFFSYAMNKRSSPRKRRGISDDLFETIIRESFNVYEGYQLCRVLFFVYTINEFSLSWSDVQEYGKALTIGSIKEKSSVNWELTFPRADGNKAILPAGMDYIQQVFLPYKKLVLSMGVHDIGGHPIFCALNGRASLSGGSITRLLARIRRVAAASLMNNDAPRAKVEQMRKVTINTLAHTNQPKTYFFKKSILSRSK